MTFHLRQAAAREQVPLAEPVFARWRSTDGEITATFHRLADGLLIRFLDRADFHVALEAGEVTCWPTVDSPESAVSDLYLNQVEPMLLGHQGEVVIHASAVAIGGRVAAFVAPTGRGKSTLAAAFARSGMPFLSDDGVRLARDGAHYLAHPNRPSFRLWQDSEAAVRGAAIPEDWDEVKSRVEACDALPFQNEALPLAALYFLGPGDSAEPTISPMPMRAVAAELVNHTFFLDAEDRWRMARLFESLMRLAEAVPSFALDYPRAYARLPDVIGAVSGHMLRGDIH